MLVGALLWSVVAVVSWIALILVFVSFARLGALNGNLLFGKLSLIFAVPISASVLVEAAKGVCAAVVVPTIVVAVLALRPATICLWAIAVLCSAVAVGIYLVAEIISIFLPAALISILILVLILGSAWLLRRPAFRPSILCLFAASGIAGCIGIVRPRGRLSRTTVGRSWSVVWCL